MVLTKKLLGHGIEIRDIFVRIQFFRPPSQKVGHLVVITLFLFWIGFHCLNVKDTIAGAKETIAGAKETIAGAKETIAGAKETISGAKETIAGAKETIAGARTHYIARKLKGPKNPFIN